MHANDSENLLREFWSMTDMHNSVSLGTQEEVGKTTSCVDGFPELSRRWKSG